MNSEDAFRARGKGRARRARDGRGMCYRCNPLHSQGENLDGVWIRAVCCSDGKKVNALRSKHGRAAQGGGAIVMRCKGYSSRQVAGEAERAFRMSISGCNSERICGSDDKSGIIDAGDKRRSCNRQSKALRCVRCHTI